MSEELTIAKMSDAVFEPSKPKVVDQEEITEVDPNEMLRRLRELAEAEARAETNLEPTDGIPPLEEALEKALWSLNEISVYATYGRMQECVREANEALTALNALKQKYDEQNNIMTALSATSEQLGGYA